MDPEQIASLLDHSKVRGFVKVKAVHIIVKAATKLKNLIDFVTKKLSEDTCEQICFWGLPGGVGKAVSLTEHVKTLWVERFPITQQPGSFALFQCTRIFLQPVQIRVENYLVKANKPAMVIIVARKPIIEDLDAVPLSGSPPMEKTLLPLPGEEMPATETPFPSRRKKNHQKKKRRNLVDKEASGGDRPLKRQKISKKEKQRQSLKNPQPSEGGGEKFLDPSHRLRPALKASSSAVGGIGKI